MGLIFGSKVQLKKMPDLQIKASVKDADTDRYIFLRSRILTCDEPNGNGDFIPTDEVLKFNDKLGVKAYETFKGTIVDYNHETSIKIGDIIDVIYMEGKNGEKNSIDIICRIDRQAPAGLSNESKLFYDHIISRIDGTDLCEMSMEAFADNAECNFCGTKFAFAEPCDHIRNYMNAKIKAADNSEVYVYRIDRDLRFVGAGIVENPADKNAQFKNLMAKKEDDKKKLSSEVLENISGMDLLKIVNALEDGEDRASGIADQIVAKITEPIYETELSKFIDKHLTAMEIRIVKQQLIKAGKMISAMYNAHLIRIEGQLAWLVMQNGLPILKKQVKDIWGDKWEGEIDGMKISEYAVSDTFKRNLLLAIQEKGIEYLEASWSSETVKLDNRAIEDVLKVKAVDKDKWAKIYKSLGGSFTACVDKMKGKVDNVESYCSWLEHEATGKWPTEAKLTASEKNQFQSCITSNINNGDIKPGYGQDKQSAVESYCFKQVFGIKASLSDTIAEIIALGITVSPDVVGGQQAFQNWAIYKQTGVWPVLLASRLHIKIFANAVNKLSFEEREVFIRSSNLLKYGFTIDDVNKYHILAADKDIEKLQKYGMTTPQIRELFEKRFGI